MTKQIKFKCPHERKKIRISFLLLAILVKPWRLFSSLPIILSARSLLCLLSFLPVLFSSCYILCPYSSLVVLFSLHSLLCLLSSLPDLFSAGSLLYLLSSLRFSSLAAIFSVCSLPCSLIFSAHYHPFMFSSLHSPLCFPVCLFPCPPLLLPACSLLNLQIQTVLHTRHWYKEHSTDCPVFCVQGWLSLEFSVIFRTEQLQGPGRGICKLGVCLILLYHLEPVPWLWVLRPKLAWWKPTGIIETKKIRFSKHLGLRDYFVFWKFLVFFTYFCLFFVLLLQGVWGKVS